jgi:hypothetical protein
VTALLILAALQQQVSIQAEHAWGGRYRPHFWAPVRIAVDNPGKVAEGTLRLRWTWPGANPTGSARRVGDIEGGDGPVYELPVALPERSRRVYTAYVRAPEGMSLWVGFEPKEGRPPRPVEVFALPAEFRRPFVAVVGKGLPEGLRTAAGGKLETAVASPDALPDRWLGYAPLDALVWTGGDAGEMRDPRQAEALKQWVAGGGHLAIVRAHLVGIEGTELEELLPIEAAAPIRSPVPTEFGPVAPGDGVFLQGRVRPGARALVPGAIYRSNYGRGRITLLAFDPSGEPFKSWGGLGALWDRVLVPRIAREEGQNEWRYVDSLGAALGSTALADAAFQFPGVETPSLAWVFWLILAYVILVGPVDYLVLRRLRRQELTWVTFPACVIAFLALAAAATGTSVRRLAFAREMEVMDLIPDVGIARTLSIGSVLTPLPERFGLPAGGPNEAVVPLISGSLQFGGDSRSLDRTRIAQTDRIQTEECPVERGSTTVSLRERIDAGPASISFELEGSALIVRNDAGATLRDAWLLTPDGALKVGDLPPGRSERRSLRSAPDFSDRHSTRALGGLDSESARWRTRTFVESEDFDGDIRRLLLGLALPPRSGGTPFLTGPARQMDVRPWLEDGGMVLVGWLETEGGIRYRGLEPERSALVLARVFSK